MIYDYGVYDGGENEVFHACFLGEEEEEEQEANHCSSIEHTKFL